MQRRQYLTVAGSIALLSGCLGSAGSDDGFEDVDGGTVIRDSTFSLEAAAGDQLRITVEVNRGMYALIDVWRDGGDLLLEDETETEETWIVDVEETGVHYVWIATDGRARASIERST